MNEVRVLCNSMLLHDNVMTADGSIKLQPAKSVLKLLYDDAIALNEANFVAVSTAFFDEIERRVS